MNTADLPLPLVPNVSVRSFKDAEREFAATNGALDLFFRKVCQQGERLERIDERLTEFKGYVVSRFDQIDVRFDEVEGRLDGLEMRMDSLEGRMDSLEKAIVHLSAQVGLLVTHLLPPAAA